MSTCEFDYLYLPPCVQGPWQNISLAFINFTSTGSAQKFFSVFAKGGSRTDAVQNAKEPGSQLRCRMSPAHVQGLLANIENFVASNGTSALTSSHFTPLVFINGFQVRNLQSYVLAKLGPDRVMKLSMQSNHSKVYSKVRSSGWNCVSDLEQVDLANMRSTSNVAPNLDSGQTVQLQGLGGVIEDGVLAGSMPSCYAEPQFHKRAEPEHGWHKMNLSPSESPSSVEIAMDSHDAFIAKCLHTLKTIDTITNGYNPHKKYLVLGYDVLYL
eukprot:TRINITY_DN48232_c0_g1_i1.p1 TRINITY_DN48232_c0_g1~~TRINITY_DN48232_c0_g1_i1.p1  ORF type:complete len:284 (+),score=30.93 TRINITY_DN48232_c0_g1_i1:48-854(+)